MLQRYEAKCNEGFLEQEAGNENAKVAKKRQGKPNSDKNCPHFDVGRYIERIYGVDILRIYGIHNISALEILSEIGTDLSKWQNEKHFVSWLNLCPNNKISGGKLISSRLFKRKPNPAGLAFRQAANAVQKSDHWLGDYFRRKKTKGGNKYAIVATANKIATIFYKMVREQKEFNPIDVTAYQQRTTQTRIAHLERKLSQLKANAELVA